MLANVPSQSEIEARLNRLKQGQLIVADIFRQLAVFFIQFYLYLFKIDCDSCFNRV